MWEVQKKIEKDGKEDFTCCWIFRGFSYTKEGGLDIVGVGVRGGGWVSIISND
jgi:hypothetical protein